MLHPRTLVRREIAEALRAALPGVRVQQVLIQDGENLQSGDDIVAITIPSESVDQVETGEGHRSRPAWRTMSLTVAIYSVRPGNGEASQDAADELSRRVEVFLNGYSSALSLVSTGNGIIQAKPAVAVDTLEYLVELEELDPMTAAS